MLSKEVCEACNKRYGGGGWIWSPADEGWAGATMHCPSQRTLRWGDIHAEVKVSSEPPAWCEFKLEHLISGGLKDGKAEDGEGEQGQEECELCDTHTCESG